MKKGIMLTLLLMIWMSVGAAVIENGYYKLKNVASSYFLGVDYATSGLKMYGSASNTTYEAIWKITNQSNGSVIITNVYTQKVIRGEMTVAQTLYCGTSPNYQYPYKPEKIGDNYRFVFYRWDNSCALYLNQGCHSYNNGTDSQWKLEAVTIADPDAVAGARKVEIMNNDYAAWNTKLGKYFKDLSCSELQDAYQNMTDAELLAATTELGSDLQNIALKVKNKWNDDGVSGRTQQFRVQTYKVYSDAYTWASKLGSWSMGDMNNPTGIYANQHEILYVFVGGDIPSGTELRLAPNYGNGYISRSTGPKLHCGMNTLMISGDNYMQWVMYTAVTNPTTTPLSTYPDLKIHIEGGHVLGYMNCESQNGYSTIKKESETEINAKYAQVLADANTLAKAEGKQGTLWFTTKGNYGVFLFPLSTYNTVWGGGKIYRSMLWYDNVLMWIYDLMGINKRTIDGEGSPAQGSIECVTGGEDFYPTYCNNKALTILDENDKNPNGGSWHTDYPSVAAVQSSYKYDDNPGMDNWCTAHESGHQNQSRINMASGTEVSNNLYSNVVVYNHGYRLSRGETLATNLSYYLDGTQYAHRGGGITHRMYYQLYLYYHLAQHRMDFYPRLFKLLRDNPMNINSGKDSFLKFYKYCCMAAEEDLTEYFRVWGFFVPFTNEFFGDYTNRYLTLTKEEIDAVITEVKAMGYKRNDQIILIEDRIRNSLRTDMFATGTEYKVAMDRSAGSGVGDLGHYTDFMEGTYSKGSYSTYSRSGNTITVSGNGGVGFLVYNGDNEVIGFSNKKTFTLNEGAFSHNNITYWAIDGDGNKTQLTRNTGDAAQMLTQLNTYIKDAEWVIGRADNTETQVGYFHPSALTNLQELLNQAKSVKANAQDYLYDQVGSQLSDETNKVKNSTYSRIWFATGNSYYLANCGYTWSPYLICNDSGGMELKGDYYKQKWLFETAGGNNFYFKNVNTNKYFNNMTRSGATATATSKSDAYAVSMNEYEKEGKFYINPNDKKNNLGNYCYLGYEVKSSTSECVCGTSYDTYYVQWRFILADETSASKATSALATQVAAAEAAMNKVGYGYKDVTYTYTPKTLRTCKGPFSLSTNAPEAQSGCLENLYGTDMSKGFHSSWSAGSLDGGPHYIQIDCGYSDKTDLFKFAFYNLKHDESKYSGNNSPTEIIIRGSNDGTNFTDIRTLTTADGLPTVTGKQSQFVSGLIGTPGVKYRYLRFVVTKTSTDDANYIAKYGYPYFYLSKFAITKAKADMVYTAMDGYTDVSKSAILDVKREVDTAKSLLDTGTESQKNVETPILKKSIERLTAATAAKTPDEELMELTDDEMYKYEEALDEAIGDAKDAQTAMDNTVLADQISAAERVRNDTTSTYLNMTEEKEVITSETKSEMKSFISSLLTSAGSLLDEVLENHAFNSVDSLYEYEKKDDYSQIDGTAIVRLLSACDEAKALVVDEVYNDTATNVQKIIVVITDLKSAFDGLNQSKLNIDKVANLENEDWFKYYANGDVEKPGDLPYSAFVEMKKVYDDSHSSADDIVDAWNEYLAAPRALPKPGHFYRFRCVELLNSTSNNYLLSTLVDVTVNNATTKRLAMSTAGSDDNSIFLWTGKNLCGYSTNSIVKVNSKNMLTSNQDNTSSNTDVSFESKAGTKELYLKFTGTSNEARYAYGAKAGNVDAGGSAPDEYAGYRWYIEPVTDMGNIRDYAVAVIEGSDNIGWPGYRTRSAAKSLRLAVAEAQSDNPDSLLAAFSQLNNFRNSFQYPQDGMMLRLRGSNSGNYLVYGQTKNGNNANRYSLGTDATTSIFYFNNNNLLCYDNGIYMNCSIDNWNWKEKGAESGGTVGFARSGKTNNCTFFILIPSSRSGSPIGVMYDNTSLTDQGAVADSTKMRALTQSGYYWYLDLVESLPVTIGSVGYSTFSAPVPLRIPEGLTAYYAEDFIATDALLSMRRVDGIIPANTGVVLKGVGTFNLPIVYDDDSETIPDNKLYPVVASAHVVANDGYTAFILGKKNDKLSFYPINTSSNTVGGHKSYLELNTDDVNTAASVKSSLSINWNNEITDIVEINSDCTGLLDGATYNLSGQKVGTSYKGTIIRNGKKYLK